jgi:glycine/D-amino acid oxidase-like deaminating enzyme
VAVGAVGFAQVQFPNWSLQLPGYSYAGDDPDGFAGYREVLATIEEYAAHVRAPVREHTEVVDLTEDDTGGGFVVSVANGAVHAQHVVLATGPFQRPRIPEVSRQVSAAVLQTDPTRYRCPEQLPEGDISVRELAADGVAVLGRIRGGCGDQLSVAGDANQVLEEADEAYATFLDAARNYARTTAGDDLAEEQPMVSTPRPTTAVTEIDTLNLARADITTIIWATGYTYDYHWVKIRCSTSAVTPSSGADSAIGPACIS